MVAKQFSKLSLQPRKENEREPRAYAIPTQFSLSEIKKHFEDSMESIKAQYDVADALLEKNNSGCKTIWRSQVVLAEGVLDFYLHEMSKYCLFRMFVGEWKKSDKYASLMIPISKVEQAIDSADSDWFFSYLNERFIRAVFLSKDSMKEQLNLISIDFNQVVLKAFPNKNKESSIKKGSKIIEDLFIRRNAIAHQNDRSHASAKQHDINKKFVVTCIANIEAIVNSIHAIAIEKDR
ncbi:MAG: hypothetical protein K6F05_00015 [Succinivibrio sp.]|nr:hypothetical protein [Succinivibrio sp.]